MMRYIIPTAVGLLYLVQGIYHLCRKEWGFGIMWVCYAFANFGIIVAMLDGQEGNH